MIPRGKIDLSWPDILSTLPALLRFQKERAIEDEIEKLWGETNTSITLSVRSAFDALLTTLCLPQGSEIIFSAYTVKDMVDIALAHGLIPVPLDIEPDTLSTDLQRLHSVVNNNTKLLMFAHLFGARAEVNALIEFAKAHDILFIEDCAQAFTGDCFRGSSGVDVTLFSFGPIKTATALGGGIISFQNPKLHHKFTHLLRYYPRQRRTVFLIKVLKYAGIKIVSYRMIYRIFTRTCLFIGVDYNHLITSSLKNFSGKNWLDAFRRQPCRDLLYLLRRRVRKTTHLHCRQRAETGDMAAKTLRAFNPPGLRVNSHSHWVFPVLCGERDRTIKRLQYSGFDANTGSSSMHIVQDYRQGSRYSAHRTASMYEKVVFLPIYAGISAKEVEKMARIISDSDG